MKINMDTAANAGFIVGTTILKKILNSPAPSILAASKMESGIDIIFCLIKNIANGEARDGKMIAWYVLSQSNQTIISNKGISVT